MTKPQAPMLTLRPDQLSVIEADQLRRFERDTVQHVRTCLADHHLALGEAGTWSAVRQGIAEAQAHGLQTRLGITVYVRLMFVFGARFAERFDWARDALADVLPGMQSDDEGARVGRLSDAALAHAQALAAGQQG